MTKKILPIGSSDYKSVIDKDLYYVDKTLLIKELKERGGLVTLLPRPRRFGKTLALSMLRYFYESDYAQELRRDKVPSKSNAYLFEDKKIWQTQERELQGKFPVIFLTFKDVKESTWESAFIKMRNLIAEEFGRHRSLIESSSITEQDHEIFTAILNQTAPQAVFENSLRFLSRLLERHYQQKVVVLIDEYDSPIHAAYMHDYYDQMIGFMRGLLCGVFKDNSSLERGVITGILRTAKEGIFSGLNNLKVASLLDKDFADQFGFTQSEADQILVDYQLSEKKDELRSWYNGYRIGAHAIYNPWSVLNYVDQDGRPNLYWVNTSNNDLVKQLLAHAPAGLKQELELLLEGKTITKPVTDKMILPGMLHDSNSIWNLLLFSGYVTALKTELFEEVKIIADLAIPNKEIRGLYYQLVEAINQEILPSDNVIIMLNALTTGDIKLFTRLFQEYVISSMSSLDIGNKNIEPEAVYHMFVLGLLAMLIGTHVVKSNRESGYGRYDIMIIPKDRTKLGIVIEFKRAYPEEDIQQIAQSALVQIKTNNYAQELQDLGINNILELGIAFKGKEICVLL